MFPAASPDTSAPSASRSTSTDTVAATIVVLAYAAAQIVLFAGHVPWRDEGQAWLWAQALATPAEFFAIPGEGHPPLWYWVLRGLSQMLDFSQARYLTLGVALLNAVLLQRLLRGQLLLLVLVLCTYPVMQFWGYHFRPYGLIFTALLGALLLERAGRNVAATWLLALACGLHFFAGLLFGFWLLVQVHRGTPIRHLLAPAVLAALFGLSAVISSLGNPEGVPTTHRFFDIIAYNLAWPTPWTNLRGLPVALVTVGLICYGLWRQKFILGALLALLLAFSIGSAVLYGQSPWHSAFLMMTVFMGFMLAGDSARRWVLMLLLAPQALVGIAVSKEHVMQPAWTQPDLYDVVSTDAGPGFDPPSQLVAWQDFILSAAAAEHDITYRSGNTGELLGPVDWRHRVQGHVDPILATHATPYWLVCGDCEPALAAIEEAGRTATELASTTNFDGDVAAYRIE